MIIKRHSLIIEPLTFLLILVLLSAACSQQSREVDTNILDCKQDENCFLEALENCKKAKMDGLVYRPDGSILKEVVDIKGKSCNVLYSLKLGLESNKWFKDKFNQMDELEFKELNDDAEDEFGFRVSRDQIINALNAELNIRLSKEAYLSGRQELKKTIGGKKKICFYWVL